MCYSWNCYIDVYEQTFMWNVKLRFKWEYLICVYVWKFVWQKTVIKMFGMCSEIGLS